MTIHENFLLKDILYYRIGGTAKYLLTVQNSDDLEQALNFAYLNSISPIVPIGLGANVLFNDKDFQGCVLWFAKPCEPLIRQLSVTEVEAFASHTLDELIQFGFTHHLIGLEWAGGLPSSIGGAIRGNVGAFGGEIQDSVEKVEIFELFEKNCTRKEYTRDQLQFIYRGSIVRGNKNLIISKAVFFLKKATDEEVKKAQSEYQAHIQYREKNHAIDHPSCGSVFKNIKDESQVDKIVSIWPDIKEQVEKNWYGKVAMGYIINRLGLSGYTKGGAQVSEKHANYIINKDNASFEDVLSIIGEIKKRFFDAFGFYPEPEVEIVK